MLRGPSKVDIYSQKHGGIINIYYLNNKNDAPGLCWVAREIDKELVVVVKVYKMSEFVIPAQSG